LVNHDDGIVVPDEEYDIPLGRWERQSVELTVSRHYREIFAGFAEYFEGEMDAIGDDSLEKELELIEKLSNY
jgi:hypothetical protein